MAWKLLKDAPKSAMSKAQRGMPTTVYMCAVARATFRAHFLGVAASWIVQVGVDIYRRVFRLFNSKEDIEEEAKREEFQLGGKIYGATFRCILSLVFAAIGAGLGATFIRFTWSVDWLCSRRFGWSSDSSSLLRQASSCRSVDFLGFSSF